MDERQQNTLVIPELVADWVNVLAFVSTVERLIYDPPHERPPSIYDHISCNGWLTHCVSTLVNDHPANATSDRVVWIVTPDERLRNECPIEGSTFYITTIGGST